MKMNFKEFVKYYSYGFVRIFVDQIAIALFAVAVATGANGMSHTLVIASSVFSVLFFLFMVAELTFRQGTADSEKIALGRFKKNNLTGLYMGLFANIPNLILALMYAICRLFEAGNGAAAFANVAMKLIYGEYLGLLTIEVGGRTLGLNPISFFVMMVPALLTAFIGYYVGVNNIIVIKPTKKDLE